MFLQNILLYFWLDRNIENLLQLTHLGIKICRRNVFISGSHNVRGSKSPKIPDELNYVLKCPEK